MAVHAHVPETAAAADARLDNVFANSPAAMNRTGDAAANALGLPTWDEVVESCGASLVLKQDLWTEYEQIRDRKMRVGRMSNLLRFSRATPQRRVLAAPFPVNPADPQIEPFVDDETINHFLSPNYAHRNDGTTSGSNHMRYWPLLVTTTQAPLEV